MGVKFARATGIITRLIYHSFPGKEGTLLAGCAEAASQHLDLFHQTVEIANPLERFDFIVRELKIWMIVQGVF